VLDAGESMKVEFHALYRDRDTVLNLTVSVVDRAGAHATVRIATECPR
jgi:hypothetical protein